MKRNESESRSENKNKKQKNYRKKFKRKRGRRNYITQNGFIEGAVEGGSTKYRVRGVKYF